MGSSSSHRSFVWTLPVFVLLTFVVFWPVLGLSAFSDDHSALWHSALHGAPWRNGFFRPLSDLSFRWMHQLGATTPAGQRAFNVALHGANAFLVFALFMRLFRTGDDRSPLGAWCAALLFLIYPFHQESIVWLVGRESSLGAFFALLGLLASMMKGPGWLAPLLVCSALFVGSLCYESVLLLPLMVVVISYLDDDASRVPWRLMVVSLLITLVAYGLFRLFKSTTSEDSYLTGMVSTALTAIPTSIPKVMARLILPPLEPTLFVWLSIAALLLLAPLCIVAERSLRQQPLQRRIIRVILLVWACACIIPVIGGVSTRTSESDRFLYLPSVFLCMLLGALVVRVARTPMRLACFAGLLVVSALGLRKNHEHWRKASATTGAMIERLPAAPFGTRVFITGLPDSYEGAFIFRNGFVEAVHLSGRNGAQYVPVQESGTQGVVHFRGEDILPGPSDRWFRWNGYVFEER